MSNTIKKYAIYKNSKQIGEYVLYKNCIRLNAAENAMLNDIVDAARFIAKYFQMPLCMIVNHTDFYIGYNSNQIPTTDEIVKKFNQRSR